MKRWLTFACLFGLAFSSFQCKDEEAAQLPAGQKVEADVLCQDCKKTDRITLSSTMSKETWPKQCASCKKTSLYPYKDCVNCAQPVPLKNSSTGKFGYPELCPSCNKKWEN